MKYSTLTSILVIIVFLTSCRSSDSQYISDRQRGQLQTSHDSLQAAYKSLMNRYEASSDTMPENLRSLYGQLRQMHDQMDTNYRQMMGEGRGGMMRGRMNDHMKGNKMMRQSRKMGRHMQSHMAGEWSQQMMSMHDRMAGMHRQMGQQGMAKMNQKMAQEYGRMRSMMPGLDEPTEVPFNEQGDPSKLNGGNLYDQNCASCHGSDAGGIAGAFPPLINTERVTGDKSVSIRILLHGLSGEIEVNGQTYQGVMPSFKARMSAAEIAAILNYLRSQSSGDLPEITQNDVIQVAETYPDRTLPWNASELQADE